MFLLNLNNMEFMAKHGVLESEKKTPQKFIVNIKIETDQIVAAAKTDDIKDALNYADIYRLTHNIMMNESHDLIETIAMKIAKEIVDKYASVICAITTVTKVNPPIKGFTGTVSCEYTAFGDGYDDDEIDFELLFDDFENEFNNDDGGAKEQDDNIISFPGSSI